MEYLFTGDGHSRAFDVMTLQEQLLTLTDESIEPLADTISGLGYLSSADMLKQLTHTLYRACAVRPPVIPRLVVLISILVDRAPPLKDLLLPTDLPRQRWYRSFLTHCIGRQVVSLGDVSSFLHGFPLSESLFLLFAWFAPSLLVFSPDDLATLLEAARAERRAGRLTPELSFFVDRFEEMSADNWRLHKEYFQSGYSNGSIAYVIRRDDIVRFKALLLQPARVDTLEQDLVVDVNQRIENPLFERCEIVRHRPTLLQFAAFFSAWNCFRFLLSLKEIDANAVDDEGVSLVRFAVAGGDRRIIHQCDRLGLDFSGSAMTAVQYERFDLLQMLLEGGLQTIDSSTEAFPSVLHCAAMFDNIKALLFCLDQGVDVNLRDADDLTPLHHAAKHGQLNALIVLLSVATIDVNSATRRGRTPLHLAARHAKFDAVRILLADDRVDVNAAADGGPPLAFAIRKCDREFVQILLGRPEIDIRVTTEAGMAPVHLAVEMGRMDILAMLLQHPGVDVNAQTSAGLSVVHIAVQSNCLHALQMLLTYPGIDVNLRDLVCFDFTLVFFLITTHSIALCSGSRKY